MKDVKALLKKELQDEIVTLEDMDMGSNEQKIAIDGVAKLAEKFIEMEKLENDKLEKAENREIDIEMKLKQMAEDRKERIVKNAVTVGTTVVGAALTVWGTLKTLKFEETGTVTTSAGREFIKKLFSKK